MTIGFRIRSKWERTDPGMIDAFRSLPTANVSDCMSRLAAGGVDLRPMHRDGTLAGPALTVKTRPGDNLMLHKAIDMAAPGDVIVVDAGGDTTNSLFGELMLAHAITRHVAGFVIYGAVRDAHSFPIHNLPVFALGVTHRGPYRTGPGEIGFPISIGGMGIAPGDLILGDFDGVVVVPKADAGSVLAATQKRQQSELQQFEAIALRTLDRTWVDETLRRLGCVEVD